MTIYGTILPGAISVARWADKAQPLTEEAKKKLKILDWHKNHGKNVSLTAKRFGRTRKTIRGWQKRFDRYGLIRLNEQSRRPKNVRQPTAGWQIVSETAKLKKQYPAWSKYKIRVLLERKGIPHYFIYPRTPKQNTYVENSHGSDEKEFYLQGDVCSDLTVMQAKIKNWQDTWNGIRPHEALNYLTPYEYFIKW